jgi:cobalt-zinc-cadmium resistance protein CzcA
LEIKIVVSSRYNLGLRNTKKSAVWRFGIISFGRSFYHYGGEFIPTLDEGDFVIQPVLKTGTSLTKPLLLLLKSKK